jgi:hypothetical protein
VPIT